jgi:DNA-binding GntR family transcriptional regulator
MSQMDSNERNRLRKIHNIRFLGDRAYEIIKEAIVSLKLKPGERLKASELAEELGISATPIREALSRLEQEGFVEIVPFKGAFVCEIDHQSVKEIFELRELLEIAAAKKATANFSPGDLHKGETFLEEMRRACDATDVKTYLKRAKDFHELFINKCGNQKMISVIRSFNDHLERMREAVSSSESIPLYIEDYERILAGFKSRNTEETERALLAHLERVKESLLKRKEQKKSLNDG